MPLTWINKINARSNRLRVFAAATLLCCAGAAAQSTPESVEVSNLLKAGQYDQALHEADKFLVNKPKDAQMRFLKGLIYTEQKKTPEAIQIFTRLTEDYPELPEPYNNLAVLYASQGKYEKARDALEMAIRTHPSYATAHENLGDVYAKLASQAYDKALQLDSSNTAAQTKLSLVREMIGGGHTSPTPAPAVKPVPITSAPATAAAPAATAPATAPAPAATTKPAANSKPAAKEGSDEDEVKRAVQTWATAWSNQDTKTYLAAYGAEFKTPNNQSRAAWEEERRQRIEGKRKISVALEDVQISLAGSQATVKFRQLYTAPGHKTRSRKTLVMSKTAGKWQIVQESSGG